MSAEYPIVAITGSSDHSTTGITLVLQRIFFRERIKAVYIPGSGFHRYEREHMRLEAEKAQQAGQRLTHYGPEGNHFGKLESMFFQYASTGTGQYRYYLHSNELAEKLGQNVGTFTPWQALDADNDLLVYRGLHGAVVHEDIDLSSYPDLLIGAIPNLNLEWMRRIDRDTKRGFTAHEVRNTILERMYDYAHYIVPQFERTHINFQIIPMVDTSDPFHFEELPTLDECYLIVHLQKVAQQVPIAKLVKRFPGAFVTRRDTLVVPGAQMLNAIEVILMPFIHDLITKSRELRGITEVSKDRGAGILGLYAQLG